VKIIVVESSDLKYLPETLTNQVIEARMQGVSVVEAYEFYEEVYGRIPLVKLDSNQYIVNDVFSIGVDKIHLGTKRFFDLFFSFLILPFVLLLILFGCLLVFFTSPGKVFYVQERVGRNSKPFKIFKLRTMKQKHNGSFTVNGDDRLLKVGRFLRRTKIDELPQLYNVLKGDMSLIGPRPERPKYVATANAEYAYFDLRHLVRPGITGWAQVNLPKATPKENLKKLEFDLYYIKNYSFLLDFKIILRTIKVVLTLNSN
jgi:lipopolysaccharide/colanic/teichoic acid biosynthesis glycosyltransferase